MMWKNCTSRDPSLNDGGQVRRDSDGGVQGERGAEQAAGGGPSHHHVYHPLKCKIQIFYWRRLDKVLVSASE